MNFLNFVMCGLIENTNHISFKFFEKYSFGRLIRRGLLSPNTKPLAETKIPASSDEDSVIL